MKDMSHREMIQAVEALAVAGAIIFVAFVGTVIVLLSRIERAIKGNW